MTERIFTDLETSGLISANGYHEILEAAWAVETQPIRSIILPHTLKNASPEALKINRYYERGLDDRSKWATEEDIAEFREALKGKTLAGFNIRFDATFLNQYFGEELFNYRLLDVESYVAGVFRLDGPVGGKGSVELLRNLGYVISWPDHTAAADVEAVRDTYFAAQDVTSYS